MLVDITPGACTYSFAKCSALYQRDGKLIQNYMAKLSNKNVVRNYEYKITWDKKDPSARNCVIRLVAQKCLLTNKGTGTLRFLLDDNMKIDGCQMLIAQTWYNSLTSKDLMKFTSEFTYSTFKRVFKEKEQVGLMLDIHLRKDKPQLEKLSY